MKFDQLKCGSPFILYSRTKFYKNASDIQTMVLAMTALLSNKISLIAGMSAFVASLYAFAPAPAAAAQLQRCAGENETCRLPYPAEVIYGANGRGTSQFIDGPNVRCSNQVFGDPAPGARKSCSFVVRDRMKTGVMIAAMIGATIDAMTAAMTGVTTGAMIEVAVTGNNARKKKDSAIFMAVRSCVTEPRGVS